ncbi:MAG: cobalamin-dependent protein [Flavobacteriales bacterium]|nr:cobalamin-dependent protein [Flavobacteriales bacterium]QQS72171.1 MAG: cobalamin-dependent protein [Flavobacteriales bacterium]HRA15671.1 methylmalonyl-CoA mutase family protein [Flavobacteriales bacterium]
MSHPVIPPYVPKHKIRIVTAASLFDGHDVAINIMRRILQSSGAEVIHLGHDRSVEDVVNTAIQEDAHAIAMTSYQGGHVEYFKYMFDLLKEKGAGHDPSRPGSGIKIFGGGGGTILPEEIKELEAYGITRLYHPDDGRAMGLQGMINDMLEQCDFDISDDVKAEVKDLSPTNWPAIARLISTAENHPEVFNKVEDAIHAKARASTAPVLGITGTGGSGKSSMVDELIRRFLIDQPTKTIGVISVDPSKRKTGGALLGDRIRMNSIRGERVYMRSLATRQSNLALSKYVQEAVSILKAAGFDLIVLETSGIGQSDTEILDHSDVSLYIMTPEFGAATQLEKIDMLDFADVVAINKFDKRGALDAVRDVKKQYKRNHQLWDAKDEDLPVVGTIASQFNDPGTNTLYERLMRKVKEKTGVDFHSTFHGHDEMSEKVWIIPPAKSRYLSEISENNRRYDSKVDTQADIADQLYGLYSAVLTFGGPDLLEEAASLKPQAASSTTSKLGAYGLELEALANKFNELKKDLDPHLWSMLTGWKAEEARYSGEFYTYHVRGKEIKVPNHSESLAHLKIPKVALPKFRSWGDKVRWAMQENTPGFFPYTAGIYPFKRTGEDPARMFAGEGGPERTNKRFHYVSQGLPAKRLSTAFDSVTLYGHDPGRRPDIYGKVGNSGVSICCLDDAKKLYSGFDLTDPKTSVSMTINGPAPMLLGFFMNAAIDQNCEKYIRENGLLDEVEKKIAARWRATSHKPQASSLKLEASGLRPQYHGEIPEGNNGLGLLLLGITGDQVLPKEVYAKIKADTLAQVRGTVQADILKEDQAQNTCIFSTEFALRLMGDVQQYFIDEKVRNFYSVSISGYHIAEAGANPISQLAFTLSNGFTYVEYYLSRGMDINAFAPNLSFFFSNGMDPEYAVMGRVARRIWAKAMKLRYGADERSQMLKYHIQTSGRSLHAQEIDFNDIRTTLQALYAIYDNCNSLHTNAYDEAITTPTEESVRRAMAIQLIINKELGLAKNENPLQGSFIIEELTDLVEAAVLTEFDRITERGGVLGAMETMYQRSRIQEESLYYETLKHNGDYPVIGVNTFLSSKGSPTILPKEVIRATEEEKQAQIATAENLQKAYSKESAVWIKKLQEAAIKNQNMFEMLMEATKYCSLGHLTDAMFEVGGQYRRNM